MSDAPEAVVRLAEQRSAARRQRDFAGADRLRDEIAGLGWQVLDGPDGFRLEPCPVRSALTIVADLGAWPEDGKRLLDSLRAQPQADGGERLLDSLRAQPQPEAPVPVVEIVATNGYGWDRNAALARVDSDIVAFVDTSLEVTGDLLGELAKALADPSVAVAGPYGLVSDDLREYEERTTGDVVAVQGYCLAARLDDVKAVGGFRESFAFYRNADIDLSLRLRSAGTAVRRAVAVGAGHCTRHTHRAWEETDPAERDRLSRKNMRRIHDRFGDRVGELTLP